MRVVAAARWNARVGRCSAECQLTTLTAHVKPSGAGSGAHRLLSLAQIVAPTRGGMGQHLERASRGMSGRIDALLQPDPTFPAGDGHLPGFDAAPETLEAVRRHDLK